MATYIHSFQSEWLKKKRSAAAWLIIIGALFIPFIMIIGQLVNSESLAAFYASPHFWETMFLRSWESMAIFLLPMGVILSTSLMTQLEYKNNTWKQVHTSPQKLSTVFWAKLGVVLVMMLQFFILFNIGIYLAGVIPALLLPSVPYPAESFQWMVFIKGNASFYICCLPIIALQYLISLRFKNFLAPVGIGLILIIGSLFALQSPHGYLLPYTYCPLSYMQLSGGPAAPVNVHAMALIWFAAFTLAGYIFYIRRNEKG